MLNKLTATSFTSINKAIFPAGISKLQGSDSAVNMSTAIFVMCGFRAVQVFVKPSLYYRVYASG